MPSIQGSRSVTGTTTSNDIGYVDVGVLPNITGTITVYTASGYGNNDATGAFELFNGSGRGESYVFSGSNQGFSFDASRSSNIYNSDYAEVQPKRILMYFIIKYI